MCEGRSKLALLVGGNREKGDVNQDYSFECTKVEKLYQVTILLVEKVKTLIIQEKKWKGLLISLRRKALNINKRKKMRFVKMRLRW